MKKVKLIFIDLNNKETLVATFVNIYEARQCRDLLQVMQSDQDNAYYYIEYYNKDTKTISRQGPDSFHRLIFSMNKEIQRQIKLYLS